MSETDRLVLEKFTRLGTAPVRAVERAHVLLHLATGRSGRAVAIERGLHATTVFRIRQRYLTEGYRAALAERPRSGGPQRFDGTTRAALTALACTPAPVGHSHWTLRLLADKAVELQWVEAISHETVRQVLKKTKYSPSASSSGA